MKTPLLSYLSLSQRSLAAILLLAAGSLSAAQLPSDQSTQSTQSTQNAGNTAAQMRGNDQKLDNNNVNYFLIQTAAKASIEKDKNNPNGFIIILKQIKPTVSYFSDRPNRETGQLTIKEYLALWQKKGETSFQKVPPNAILQAVNKQAANTNGVQESSYYAIEISNPQYDEKTGNLKYQVKALPGNKFAPLTDKTELEQVTVLIDEVCLSCW